MSIPLPQALGLGIITFGLLVLITRSLLRRWRRKLVQDGYKIEGDPGEFLTATPSWSKSSLSEAYIHPAYIFDYLRLKNVSEWRMQPKVVYEVRNGDILRQTAFENFK